MSTSEELADQASAALDAGGPEAHVAALRALTDAVREQTKAIAVLAQRVGDAGAAAAAGRGAPKRLVKPPAPAPPAKGGDMWARLGLTEGERRRVTALFADVSGFTAMSEKLDPEEANTIMKETMAELHGHHPQARRLRREVHRRRHLRDLRRTDLSRGRARARRASPQSRCTPRSTAGSPPSRSVPSADAHRHQHRPRHRRHRGRRHAVRGDGRHGEHRRRGRWTRP